MSDVIEPTQSDETQNVDSTPTDGQENKQEKIEKTEPKTFKVKISGEEREVTESDLIRDYQIKEESFKRMKDATNLMNQVKPFIDSIKKGDLSVLKSFGIPPEALRDFSEKELRAYIKEQEMSEPEREAVKAKREADESRKKLEHFEKQEKERKRVLAADKAAKDIETEFVKVFESKKIPMKGSQRIMRQMADYMFHAIDSGNEKITAEQAFDIVTKNNRTDYTDFMSKEFARNPDEFIASLPPEIVDGIREHEIKKVRNQMPSGNTQMYGKPQKQDSQFRKWMKSEINKW